MQLIDGKSLSAKIKAKLATEIDPASPPTLAVVLVGNDPASQVYVNNKVKACAAVGINSILKTLEETATTSQVIDVIDALNQDPNVDGILVQLPLPKGLDEDFIVNRVDPKKDVDGLTYVMQGKLLYGTAPWAPCTPEGVIEMLDEYGVELQGKNAVVIGRSNLCGKPLALLLTQKNATVTLCHSKTKNLADVTRKADVIAVCTGKINTLTADMVKEGAVVIDIGINRTQNGLKGDVDFDGVAPKCSLITPVPGGVGPMTIAMLLSNTLKARSLRK